MKIEDLVVGRVYWDVYHGGPATVLVAKYDTDAEVAIKKHYKNGVFTWCRVRPSHLFPITPEQLAEFGLGQEGEG